MPKTYFFEGTQIGITICRLQGEAYNTDYCLIKFEEDIIELGQEHVRIACLPDRDPVGGEACWIAGWGATDPEGNNASNDLQASF